jgi:hypothetical protein
MKWSSTSTASKVREQQSRDKQRQKMKISGGKKKKRKKHRKEKRKRDDPPLKTNQYEYVAHADDTLMSNSGKANFPQVDDALLSNPPTPTTFLCLWPNRSLPRMSSVWQ